MTITADDALTLSTAALLAWSFLQRRPVMRLRELSDTLPVALDEAEIKASPRFDVWSDGKTEWVCAR